MRPVAADRSILSLSNWGSKGWTRSKIMDSAWLTGSMEQELGIMGYSASPISVKAAQSLG